MWSRGVSLKTNRKRESIACHIAATNRGGGGLEVGLAHPIDLRVNFCVKCIFCERKWQTSSDGC